MANEQLAKTWTKGVLIAASLAMIPAASPADWDVEEYFSDRATDFMDIFRLRAGVPNKGRGLGAKLRVTSLLQVGAVHFNGNYLALDKRGLGIAREMRTEGGVSLWYGSRHQMYYEPGNIFTEDDTKWATVSRRHINRNDYYWDDGQGDVFSLAAEIATPILAIDAALYPSQALDFLVGIVTIDPQDDDRMYIDERHPDEFIIPSTFDGPDLEAATREERLFLDATRARIEAEQLEAEGQLLSDDDPVEDELKIERLPTNPEAVETLIDVAPLSPEAVNIIDETGEDILYEPETDEYLEEVQTEEE